MINLDNSNYLQVTFPDRPFKPKNGFMVNEPDRSDRIKTSF